MRFKKIILANLISHEAPTFKKRAVLRAGLGYIAQVLWDNNIEYAVCDLGLGYSSVSKFRKKIKEFKPDLVGCSLFTYRYRDCYEIIRKIKQEFKNIQIVAGGPHITTYKEQSLKECPEIDFGITFEGEKSIIQLCQGKEYSQISGLIYHQVGKIFYTGEPSFIEDLDALSFPQYHNFELQHYPLQNSVIDERIIPIVASRGCPFKCIYCPVKTVIGRKFRFRSVKNVLNEITYWYELGYRRFSFVDDNFTLIRERVLQICEEIRKNNLRNLILSLPNGIRADKTDYELLKIMYSVGFKYIGIGVEGGNNRILKILKKQETIETIKKTIKNATDIGYYVDLYFLVGSPGETEKDVYDSISVASQCPVDNIFFFNLIPYPGTELFDWVKKNNYFLYSPEYYLNKIHSNMDIPVFQTPEFSANGRRKMIKFARKSAKKLKVKIYIEKLNRIKIKGIFAKIIANVYASNSIQRLFNDLKTLQKLKRKIIRK